MRKSMFLGLTDRNDLMMETVCSVALMIFWNCSSSLTSCSETVSVEPGGYICQRGKAWLGASFSGAPGSGLVQRHDRFRVLMLRVLDPNLHHLVGWSVHSDCKSSCRFQIHHFYKPEEQKRSPLAAGWSSRSTRKGHQTQTELTNS